MDLRLPLEAIARQHGLVVTEQALANALRNGGNAPELFPIQRLPQAQILPSSHAEVVLDGDCIPSAGEGKMVRT